MVLILIEIAGDVFICNLHENSVFFPVHGFNMLILIELQIFVIFGYS